MAALLALLTILIFVAIDYLVSRRALQRAGAPEPQAVASAIEPTPADPMPALEPVWVAGYQMPEELHYHRGHTWARVLSPDTVAIGVDDFARRLIGRASAIEVPAVGAWLRQGASGVRIESNGRSAEVLSPVEGEVIEVNPGLREHPAHSTADPFGRGWLCKVRSANLAANLRNLMHGSLAQRWIEDSREQLEMRLMALSGSVLQDGGEVAPDFARHVDDKDWEALVELFLLT